MHSSLPIYAIPGSLVFSKNHQPITTPSLFSTQAAKQKLAGSTFFLQKSEGDVVISPKFGEIFGLKLDGSSRILVRPSAFVCASSLPEVIAGGHGLLKGGFTDFLFSSGMVGVSGNGVINVELDTGEKIVFDPENLICRDETVDVFAINPPPAFTGPIFKIDDFIPNMETFSKVIKVLHEFELIIRKNGLISTFKHLLPTSFTKFSEELIAILKTTAKSFGTFIFNFGNYMFFMGRSRINYYVFGNRGMYYAVGPGNIYLSLQQRPSILKRLLKSSDLKLDQ